MFVFIKFKVFLFVLYCSDDVIAMAMKSISVDTFMKTNMVKLVVVQSWQ